MTDESKPPAKKRRTRLLIILGVVLLLLLVRTFSYELYKIPSVSMQPTLHKGDHILVNKMAYWSGDIERGDLIVFQYPLDGSEEFIKRVVAVPGDEITVTADGLSLRAAGESEAKLVEKTLLDEPCLDQDQQTLEGCSLFEEVLGARHYRVQYMESAANRVQRKTFTVPEGKLFVLGDNRNESHDSAQWTMTDESGHEYPVPFVDFDLVYGKVTRIWLPFDRGGPVQ